MLEKIAYFQNRRDEVSNQELAKKTEQAQLTRIKKVIKVAEKR